MPRFIRMGRRGVRLKEASFSYRVAVVGDVHRREYRQVFRSMREMAPVHLFRRNECEALLERMESGEAYGVIVWFQDYPGQYSRLLLERVSRGSPTTRQVVLSGSWCEGESRTGFPVPGTIRLYWHQWNCGGEEEFKRWLEGGASRWSLPLTSGDEEGELVKTARVRGTVGPLQGRHSDAAFPDDRDASKSEVSRSHSPAAANLAVLGACPAMRRLLVDALRNSGGCPIETTLDELLSPLWREPPLACFWDQPTWDADLRYRLPLLRDRFEQTRLVALLDFPRWEEVAAWEAAGGDVVLSKPMQIDDVSRLARKKDLLRP
jgi:hypothetical protein